MVSRDRSSEREIVPRGTISPSVCVCVVGHSLSRKKHLFQMKKKNSCSFFYIVFIVYQQQVSNSLFFFLSFLFSFFPLRARLVRVRSISVDYHHHQRRLRLRTGTHIRSYSRFGSSLIRRWKPMGRTSSGRKCTDKLLCIGIFGAISSGSNNRQGTGTTCRDSRTSFGRCFSGPPSGSISHILSPIAAGYCSTRS